MMIRPFGLAVVLSIALAAPPAFGFCRTTTCDPADPKQHCKVDAMQCVTSGVPLSWRSSCVTVGVQGSGSPRNGLSYDEVAVVVERAFGTWMKAGCGSGAPSIDVKLIGPVECGVSEYNSKAGNANIVLFREDDWPYVGAANAVGLTTTRFDNMTGELWDADIELNGVEGDLSVGDPIRGVDLLSVLTHEAGHFLGLSHSPDQTATMRAVYLPQQDGTSFRTLASDDVAGICAIYPPDRKPATTSCENRHGFSSECGADQPASANESKGCSLAVSHGTESRGATGVLALLALAWTTRLARRRRIV